MSELVKLNFYFIFQKKKKNQLEINMKKIVFKKKELSIEQVWS